MIAMTQADNLGVAMSLVFFVGVGCAVGMFLAIVRTAKARDMKTSAYRMRRLHLLVKGLQLMTAAYEQDKANIILTHKKCKNCGSKKHVDEVVPVEALDGKTVPMCEDCRSMIGD